MVAIFLFIGIVGGTIFWSGKINGHYQKKIQTEYEMGTKVTYPAVISDKYLDHEDDIVMIVSEYNDKIVAQRKEYNSKIKTQRSSYNSKISKQRKMYNSTIKSNRNEYSSSLANLDSDYKIKIENASYAGIKQGRTDKLKQNESRIEQNYEKKKKAGDWNSVIMTINE